MYATNRRGPDRRDPAEDAGVDNRHGADQLLQVAVLFESTASCCVSNEYASGSRTAAQVAAIPRQSVRPQVSA